MARILLIEDDRALRRMVAEELQALGHEVREAGDGEEGLRLARAERPQAILADIGMPKVNGFALKEALDRDGVAATFMFVSGRDTRSDVADGLMLGAAHYFTKPIDFDRLAAALSQLDAAA